MVIHVRTAHHRCQAQSVAQDTEQTRQTWYRSAVESFPLLLVAVLAEHFGCLSSGHRDRGLRIWTEREARRNECETRWVAYLERAGSSSERVWNSLLVVVGTSKELVASGDSKLADCPLVAGRDAKSQSVP